MPIQEPHQLGFAQVLDIKKRAEVRDSTGFFEKMTLPEFAGYANEQENNQGRFDQGLEDSKLKRFSAGFNNVLKPVSHVTGAMGAGIADMISDDPETIQMGRQLGEGVPRGFAEVGGVIGGAALSATGVGAIAGVPLMAAAGTSAYSQGLESTGSHGVGAVNAATTLLVPGVAKVGTAIGGALAKRHTFNEVFKRVGGAELATHVPKAGATAARFQRLAEYTGANAALAVNDLAALEATEEITGHDMSLGQKAAMIGAGAIPFAVFDIPHLVRGPKGEFSSFQARKEAKRTVGVEMTAEILEAGKFIDSFFATVKKDGPFTVDDTPLFTVGEDGQRKLVTKIPDGGDPLMVKVGKDEDVIPLADLSRYCTGGIKFHYNFG